MVVAEVERRVETVEMRLCGKAHRVAEESEIQVRAAFRLYLSGIASGQPCLERCRVVEGASLRLVQLSANAEVVLVVHVCAAVKCRQREMSEVRSGKDFESRFRPFVEAFEHGDCQGVFNRIILCHVKDGVTAEAVVHVEVVRVVVVRGIVRLVYSLVIVEFERMYETRHRHVFVFHPCRVGIACGVPGQETVCHCFSGNGDASAPVCLFSFRFVACHLCAVRPPGESLAAAVELFFVKRLAVLLGLLPCLFLVSLGFVLPLRLYREFPRPYLVVGHLHLAVEPHVVAVAEENVEVVVAVPVPLQHCGYVAFAEIVLEYFRMRDIPVVGYSAVLGHLLVVCREQQVRIVPLPDVGAVHGIVEVGGALLLVVSPAIDVVELEADADFLSYVGAEKSLEMVFSVCLVTALVVRQVCYGRQGVGEQELVGRLYEVVVRLCEYELVGHGAVDEYTVDARRTEIARRVVFAPHPGCEYCVHEHV